MSAITESLPAKAHGAKLPSSIAGRAITLDIEIVSGEQWDRTIADFDGVCQEQLYLFAKTRWPSVEQEPILFSLNGEIVGGTLMMIQPLPLRLGAIAVTKWGPLFRNAGRPDAEAIYAGMVEALIAEYAQKRRLMISVLPRATTNERNYEFDFLVSRGFKAGSTLGFPNRYIVDLRLSDETQRKSFEQKWRYHLNKSEKAGLSFEHAGPERLGEFDRLYHAMTDRKQFSDHSAYETVPALMAITDPALRPELFFVRHEGTIVAGAIIFKAGDRAVYLYGATSDAALPLRAGYFMHARVISWLRDNTKARWYDLGGTDGFQGLHQFKKGMVGAAGVIRPVPPVANYAAYRLPYLLGVGAFGARDLVHGAKRKFAGLINARAKPTLARPSEGQ
jgi:hypothetical protein